jgi:FMN phosphatase YigB (HAD superfamily)
MEFPKIAIFDFDNTLYEYSKAHNAGTDALHDFLARELSLDIKELSQGLEISRQRVKNRLGYIASSHSRLLYIMDFMQTQKSSQRATLFLESEQVYWRAYLGNSELFDGVHALLTTLRYGRCKTFLVTDLTSNIQLRKLAWLGLERSFDLIITSEQAGGDKITGKPQQMLLNLVGEIPPNSWTIGDSDGDHLFPDKTLFFKKQPTGSFSKKNENRYNFSNFDELRKQVS